MFGWLRKSSKEPTNVNEPQQSSNTPTSVYTNYVHVDDKITPKPLDQNFNDINDDELPGLSRPHSVTAARPFFRAQQHLEQQQFKQEAVQSNYRSDNEDNYNEDLHDDDKNENDSQLKMLGDDNDIEDSKTKKRKWGLFKNKKDKYSRSSLVNIPIYTLHGTSHRKIA